MSVPKAPLAEHRTRLLDGMARAVASSGYDATTIADVVREAAVSRRTFYEHYGSKAECFIALYEAASHGALKVLKGAIDPRHGWERQVEHALAAYLGCMAASPELLRTLFIEILQLGPEGLAARRRMNDEIAGFILDVVNGDGRHHVSRALATAIVGGIHELVLEAIEADRVSRLEELVAPASDLVRAVTRVDPRSSPG